MKRLRESSGRSAPLLFAYGIDRFSHDVAHLSFFYHKKTGTSIESLKTIFCIGNFMLVIGLSVRLESVVNTTWTTKTQEALRQKF